MILLLHNGSKLRKSYIINTHAKPKPKGLSRRRFIKYKYGKGIPYTRFLCRPLEENLSGIKLLIFYYI